MEIFSNISKIIPKKHNTWKEKIFLTFDMDWAHDEIILDTLKILNSYLVKSTWFVTHNSSVIDILRENKYIELGIHPNFNPLLENKDKQQDFNDIITNLLKIIPEAKSIRSHSMTQNSRILDAFFSNGITHDVNHFIPNFNNYNLKPWIHWNGLIKVPYLWEDDVHILYENLNIIESEPYKIGYNKKNIGLKVINFHPIHIFLNSESIERYENTRKFHQNPNELIKYRFNGYGTRNRFIDLLKIKPLL